MLVIMVSILGGALLVGQHFAGLVSERSGQTSTPSSPVGTSEESLLYGVGEPQSQLAAMQPQRFVIRPGQNKLTYTEALELYKNSLLQFNQDCQVSSGTNSFGLNNEIMIDNRSSKPNTFQVGSSSVIIGPYDFGFLILKEVGIHIPVHCGEQKNVTTLVVQ
jgi:hypothetical protein